MNKTLKGIYQFCLKHKYWLIPLAIVGVLVFLAFESRDKDDFYIFLHGSIDFMQGKNMYAISYNDGFHYLYSGFFAILIYPLSYFPFEVAKFIWLLLNAFFLFRIFRILVSYLSFTNEKKFWFIAFSIFCCLRFILDNFHYAQTTILILYLCLQGLEWIRNDKPIQGAALIALGINIKLLPLVLLPYLLYRAYLKATLLVILFCIAMYSIPIELVGYDHYALLMQTWWNNMNPASEMNILDVDERSFHGLSTLFATLLVKNVPDPYALDISRNIADVSLETLALILNMVRAILIACTLYFLKLPPFTKARSEMHYFREMAYLLALIPLIFPHQQHYAFLFMLPALSYALLHLMGDTEFKWRKTVMVIFILIAIIFNLKLLLGEFNPYYEHFKIITYGGLCVLFILFLTTHKSHQI